MINVLKPLKFLGSSKEDLLAMPDTVRHAVGVELMVVQFGGAPSDFKPMPAVGQGVYVLHAFQKKTQKTSKLDLDLATCRYKLIGG